MGRTWGVLLLWVGRILILFGVFVLVASFFLPDAVQPLSDVLCPEGTELDNARYTPPNTPDNARLELVCTGPEYTESAAKPVALVVIGSITLGLVALYFSHNLRNPRMRVPGGPPVV